MRSILTFFSRFFRAWTYKGPFVRWLRVEKFPQSFEGHAVYILGDDECVWAAAMICPCGCGELIQLSLVPDASPYWRIKMHWNKLVSLSPSVWRTIGCRSHFILWRGRIYWCAGSEY